MKKRTLKIMTGALSVAIAVTLGVGAICLNSKKVVAETAESYTYFRSDDTMTVKENHTGAKGVGVQVTLDTAGKSTAGFEYLNYIRTSDLEQFLTIGFEPTKVGTTDFDYVNVTLTDAVDGDNKLTYVVNPQPETSGWWKTYVTSWVALTDDLVPATRPDYEFSSIAQIRGTQQSIIGKNAGNSPAATHPLYRGNYTDAGLIIGNKNAYFQKDLETSSLSTVSFGLENGTSAIVAGKEVANLTDELWLTMSSENLEKGSALFEKYTESYVTSLFPSGYVSLSVEFMNITSDTVSCYMTQIGEQTFAANAGQAKDAEPYIYVDVATNAIKDLSYRLPTCSAHNFRDGDLSEGVTVAVKNVATGANIPVENGEVVFSEAGEYSIAYTVSNPRDVAFTKEYTVTCFDERPNTVFDVQAEFATSYVTGESVQIPAMRAHSDLSRRADKSVSILTLIQRNGQVVETYENLVASEEYFLDTAGQYDVIFMHQNAFGQVQSIRRSFDVEAGIVANVRRLPVSFTVGKTNTLFDFDVISYIDGVSTEDAYRAIYIGDKRVYLAKGESVLSGSLTLSADMFTDKGNAELIYKTGASESTLAVARTFNVPVIKPYYISDYIAPLNGEGIYDETGLTVTNSIENVLFTSTTDKTFQMPQYLPADSLNISFGASSEHTAYQSLRVALKNGVNGKTIFVDVSAKGSTTSTVTVNGKEYTVSGSLTNDANYFEWVWSDDDRAFLSTAGAKLFDSITTYSDGTAFNGFNGAPVSLSFTINGVEQGEQGSFRLIKVLNQAFGSTLIGGTVQPYQDMIAPIIRYEGALASQNVNIATTLTVPKAVAYDVLDNYTALTVEATSPDGKTLIAQATCDREYSLIFSVFGIYKITYVATDSNTLFESKTTFGYTVMDLDAPIITTDGSVAETATVGVAVTMPKAYVFDNVTKDCKYYVIVYTPHGERQVADGSYTFGYAGTYKVVYYAYDAEYNVTEKVFTVEVK